MLFQLTKIKVNHFCFQVTESFVSYLKDKVTPEGEKAEEEEEEEEEEDNEEIYIPETNAETIVRDEIKY